MGSETFLKVASIDAKKNHENNDRFHLEYTKTIFFKIYKEIIITIIVTILMSEEKGSTKKYKS